MSFSPLSTSNGSESRLTSPSVSSESVALPEDTALGDQERNLEQTTHALESSYDEQTADDEHERGRGRGRGRGGRASEDNTKGKGKQHDDEASPLRIDPRFIGDSKSALDARQAYLSPPLTNAPSDAFLFGVDVSRVFTLPDVDVDIDLGSPGSESTVSSVLSNGESEDNKHRDTRADEEENSDSSSSSFVSTTTIDSRRESTTTRKATIGDTTLEVGGIGIASPTVSEAPLPVPPPRVRMAPSPTDRVERPRRKSDAHLDPSKLDDVRTHHRRRSTGEVRSKHGRRRSLRWVRREKSQERGLSRDFFLIIVLCLGLACASILIMRPTAMAVFGYGSLGGRLEFN